MDNYELIINSYRNRDRDHYMDGFGILTDGLHAAKNALFIVCTLKYQFQTS